MKYCTNCGAKLEKGYEFCQVCGGGTTDEGKSAATVRQEDNTKIKKIIALTAGMVILIAVVFICMRLLPLNNNDIIGYWAYVDEEGGVEFCKDGTCISRYKDEVDSGIYIRSHDKKLLAITDESGEGNVFYCSISGSTMTLTNYDGDNEIVLTKE